MFRAGLVTSLAKSGVSDSICKLVGRWSSGAWLCYAKEGRAVRRSDMKVIAKSVLESINAKNTVVVVNDEDCAVSWNQ